MQVGRVVIPTVVEETPRGERSFDIYSRLLNDRIVVLGTPIDDQVANVVMAQLLHLDAEDSGRDVSLYINSPGGSSTALLAIYDTMQYLRSDVSTICVGQAASAAAVLLAAGAPGKRVALPNARILIHQPHAGGIQGQAADIDIAAREVLRLRAVVDEILAGHTGQPLEKISKDTDRDFILSADEAVAYGLVDTVMAPGSLGPLAGFRPAPPGPANGSRG